MVFEPGNLVGVDCCPASVDALVDDATTASSERSVAAEAGATAAQAAERRSVDEVIDRLAVKYPEVDRAEIVQVVADEHQSLEGRPVRDFVPVLVEKSAKKRVKALARA